MKDHTDQALTGQALDALKKAATIEDLLASLEKRIAREVTPNVVSKGAMVLQPSDERRRSGSHYTARILTEPIVETTLRPILKRLGLNPTPEQILDLKICDLAMGSGAFLVAVCRFLAELLVRAWHAHKCVPKDIPPDEDEILHARRLIAQRCLYGVDKNPMAVDLSKLSLWLATLAKDHPFTFLDHSLRCGDSLVGLTRDQIAAFHWQPKKQMEFLEGQIGKRIARATEYRRKILAARDDVPYDMLRQTLDVADEALSAIRLAGDAAVAAFFAADKDRVREQKRDELAGYLESYLGRMKVEDREPIAKAVTELRGGDRAIPAFHWQIEFPEVFTVDAKRKMIGGFDAIVGNPPFAGKNTLIVSNRDGYVDWLKASHEESHGNADLVAHFFRRAFNLLKSGGCFGLIATNTIGQGDTRSTGLHWICTHGGTIYSARKRYKWPGQAAVIVSVVHVGRYVERRGTSVGLTTSWTSLGPPFMLDRREVPLITAYLFHAGGHDNPHPLRANASKGFIGSYVLGMGFTFDDADSKGVTSPITEMHRLIAQDPSNAERIFPYIGGEEVNDSPTHRHKRYVINFGEMGEQEARRWPDLMRILEEKVKPKRLQDNRESYRRYWWQYAEKRADLMETIRGIDRVLVVARVGQQGSFTFLPAGTVYSEQLVVVASRSFATFCCLQPRPHETWARFFASSMKDDLRYTPSDCFETYPFPENFEANPTLEAVGQAYYEFRSALMVKNNEGLTKTYNRFHDPYETSPDIAKLRELHDAMDRAVLDAFGWTDLKPTCEFLLDYEDEDDEDDGETGSTSRTRKKPWRYRWPDDFRDEVLARLLDLNQKRAELERLTGLAAAEVASRNKTKKKSSRRKKTVVENGNDQSELPGF